MEKVQEFRRRAVVALELAKRATSPELRDSFVMFAETWEALARDREASLQRQTPVRGRAKSGGG